MTTTDTSQDPARIVVGVDGSENAEQAASWAADLAAELGVGVHLLYAVHLTGVDSLVSSLSFTEYQQAAMAEAERLLGAVRDRLAVGHPGLRLSVEASPEAAVPALVEASRRAGFLVLGTRGHGGFPGLLLGSVSLRLAAHGHCPTVLVPGAGAAQGDRGGAIVVGIEDRESVRTAGFALGIARRLGAQMRAVHAWEPVPPYSGYYYIDPRQSAEDAERELAAALEPARKEHPDVPVAADTPTGRPAAVLIEAARGARMLVLGAHRHHGAFSLGVGPVLHPLLAHCPCPLVIIPGG